MNSGQAKTLMDLSESLYSNGKERNWLLTLAVNIEHIATDILFMAGSSKAKREFMTNSAQRYLLKD